MGAYRKAFDILYESKKQWRSVIVWLNVSTVKVVSRVQSYLVLVKGAMVAFVFVISFNYYY